MCELLGGALAAAYPAADQQAMFYGNAARIYRL